MEDQDLKDLLTEEFARRVDAARKEAGLSLERLGELSGLHRTHIGDLVSGTRTPRLDTLVRVAGALDMEPSDLLGDFRWRPPAATRGSVYRAPADVDGS